MIWNEGPREFVDLLLEYAKKHGKWFCVYNQTEKNLKKATLQVKGEDGLLAHRELLQLLHNEQANLSFARMGVQNGLKLLQSDMKDTQPSKWKIIKFELEDYAECLATRIRGMCRQVSQAMTKTPPHGWIKELNLNGGGATSASADREMASASEKPKPEDKRTDPPAEGATQDKAALDSGKPLYGFDKVLLVA